MRIRNTEDEGFVRETADRQRRAMGKKAGVGTAEGQPTPTDTQVRAKWGHAR